MKQRLLTLSILAAATTLSQAALYTWTGGDGPWGDGNHWTHPGSTNATPVTTKDDVLIGNGSTVTRGGNLSFEKTLEVSGGSTFTFSSGDIIANKGGTITVKTGSTIKVSGNNSAFQTNAGGTSGSVYSLEGTLLASGASSNPIKAPSGLGTDGGFDFTTLGAKIQFDNFTGSNLLTYLNGKATIGGGTNSFFMIEGTKVHGFDVTDAVNGKYIQFTGSSTAGSLELVAAPVPEPSSTALLGLGGLALILRRRK